MSMANTERRMRRAGWQPATSARHLALGILLAGAAAATCLPQAAMAEAAAVQRVVEGRVELASGSPAQGAIVYLKNAKTLEVRTYISTADGAFRFGQLNSDADYTLWADYKGKKSKEKTVSAFDTKKTFEITLKVDAS